MTHAPSTTADDAGSALRRPANLIARAVAWGVVRTLIGLLAAGILVCHVAASG
ncbi:MAG: hypothetical protein ACM36B_15810 [Bacteroidota bacterium]